MVEDGEPRHDHSPVPLNYLLVQPMPEWKVVAFTDTEVILSHDPVTSNGAIFTLHVDGVTKFVRRTEIAFANGEQTAIWDYSGYGLVDDLDVHENRSDCEGRNS